MHIKEITYQFRRDFKAIYECEHCNQLQDGGGYDDDHYHQKIIPKMKCQNCGKKAGEAYIPAIPQYPEGYQI